MSSTTTATARGSTIDEAIAREELLIQIYEAELSELHRKQQEAAAENDDMMRSAGEAVVQPTNNAVPIDDPLEWMIHQDNTSESNETSSLLASLKAHEDQELSSFSAWHSSLQPVICNFCFTAVRRLPTETVVEAVDDVSMIRQKEEEQGVIVAYSCQGYFHTNPAVNARIRINFAMQPSSNSITGNPSPRRAHYIQSFQCQIESPSPSRSDNNDGASSSSSVRAEEDWTWLNGEIRVLSAVDTAGSAAASSPPNLTAWFDAVSSYLQFHAQRQACLLDLQQRYPHHLVVVCVGTQDPRSSKSSSSKSKVLLRINLLDEGNEEPNGGNSSLSLVWGWIWKQGRDMLRLTLTTGMGLKQPDLDALVQVCGDCCGRALELLLQRVVVSPETTHDEDEDHVTNTIKDKRDNKTQHVDADDEGNNQDDDSFSIAGDNDDDHQQQQVKSKNRFAKSGKRASLELDRQERNPKRPNNRKQPSDGNQKAKG